MQDLMRMYDEQGLDDLCQARSDLYLSEVLLFYGSLFDKILQVTKLAILCHNVEIPVKLEDIKEIEGLFVLSNFYQYLNFT